MGTKLNKEAYEKLIKEDIERLEKDMKQCPERDHIKTVLLTSVSCYYEPTPERDTCPKCSSKNIDMMNPMDWICDSCGHMWMN